MAKLIHIPLIGHVEFPDEMEDGKIAEAAGKLHSNARSEAISKFMEDDPAIAGLPHSQKLKELSNIAAMHDKYPRLANATHKGITSNPIATAGAQKGTPEQGKTQQ